MSCRSAALALLLVPLVAAPVAAQAPQFRADVTQTGDAPFNGTLYFGGERMRMEGVSDGEEVTAIIDAAAGSLIVLMPADRMYMTMDMGSSPFSASGATSMDPANPCASGEVSECRSLGSETVNGYASRGWEYTRNGERETAWIANELRFPVRTIEADGTTTDMTNVVMGPQPASLFAPPANYTAMDLGGFGGLARGGRGGMGGRGGPPPGGRGAVPPGARGAPPAGAAAAIDPAMAAQLAAMGLDPSVIAQMQAMGLGPAEIQAMLNMGTPTNSAPWEAGDGWVADIVVTASGSGSQEYTTGGTLTETYSLRYTASVPIPYGTPAVGAQQGPAWQLVPTLGSERGLAQPLQFSGSAEYHSEFNRAAACNIGEDAVRRVQDARATAEVSTTDHSSVAFMTAGMGRFQISGDLSTFDLMVGAGAAGSEVTTTTNTTMASCPNSSASTETETETTEHGLSANFQLTGLPLPASPSTMRGSNTVPIRFQFGEFDGELDANVEWTLRPIS